MKYKLFYKLVIIVSILYVSQSKAQTISGYVRNTLGHIVSGATVSTDINTNNSLTDEKGYFSINVKGAKYIIITGSNIRTNDFSIDDELKLGPHFVVSITVKGRYSGFNERDTGVSLIGVIPEFKPWPPPKTSSKHVIKNKVFKNCNTLNDVNELLISALDKNGYDDKSYYSVPASSPEVYGFALATKLEQIDKNGIAKKDPNRWNANHQKNEISFSEYIKALLFSNAGYFRVIVFVVTDIGFNTPGLPPSRDVAMSWIGVGHNNLPVNIKEQTFDIRYSVTALIYEYELPENSENAYLVNNFSGKKHLKKAKIWNALTQDK